MRRTYTSASLVPRAVRQPEHLLDGLCPLLPAIHVLEEPLSCRQQPEPLLFGAGQPLHYLQRPRVALQGRVPVIPILRFARGPHEALERRTPIFRPQVVVGQFRRLAGGFLQEDPGHPAVQPPAPVGADLLVESLAQLVVGEAARLFRGFDDKARSYQRLDDAVDRTLLVAAGAAEQPRVEVSSYDRRKLQQVAGFLVQAVEAGLYQRPHACR